MRTLHKQLVLNKHEDWHSALSMGISSLGDGLTLSPGTMGGGYVCLEAIDSGEGGFDWGRLSLDCEIPMDSMIVTGAYASDVKIFGQSKTLEAYLASLDPLKPETKSLLDKIYKTTGQNDDCYLNCAGRYLYLMFEFISSGAPPRLDAVRIHMSGDHMVDYLPAVYRKAGDFTKRFLSVFDSILMDMEHNIYELPARFDYENASGAMLGYLASWMCVESEGLPESEIVSRIATAKSDYEDMYTVRGVIRSVERLTGCRPFIIESAHVDPNQPDCTNSALYRRLYGENPYKFFVLLGEDVFKSRRQMEVFLERMGELIPAGTEFELVLLKRCVQLDWHTYLGVNTMVGDYTPVVIDENKTIQYSMTV